MATVVVADATSQVTSQRLEDLQLIGVQVVSTPDIEQRFAVTR